MTCNAVQKVTINGTPATVARSNVVKKLKPVLTAPEMSVRLTTVQHRTVQALDNGKKSYENASSTFRGAGHDSPVHIVWALPPPNMSYIDSNRLMMLVCIAHKSLGDCDEFRYGQNLFQDGPDDFLETI
jgi:hypothetical protein